MSQDSNQGSAIADFIKNIFVPLSYMEKNNIRIAEYLGVQKGEVVDLKIRYGFFICPDDITNAESRMPKILLKETSSEIFRKVYPELYRAVLSFYNIVKEEGLLHDYAHLKHGAKIAYLIAATEYVREIFVSNKEKTPFTVGDIYSKNTMRELDSKFSLYLNNFVAHAQKENVSLNIHSLYTFAIKILEDCGVNVKTEMQKTSDFLRSPKYFPQGIFAGDYLDEYIQKFFEDEQKASDLQALIKERIGEGGLLIPLDADEKFRLKFSNKNPSGISLPDFLYITKKNIYPLDLKINLASVNTRQISARNLCALFSFMNNEMVVLFDGITINGKTYSHMQEPLKQIQELSFEHILISNKIPKSDRNILNQLWKNGEPVNQEILHNAGITGNLANISRMFNGTLARRKK